MESAASPSPLITTRKPGKSEAVAGVHEVIVKLVAGGDPYPPAEHLQGGTASALPDEDLVLPKTTGRSGGSSALLLPHGAAEEPVRPGAQRSQRFSSETKM